MTGTASNTIIDLRIDVLQRQIAALKASARSRMHDSGAIATIAQRLRALEAEIQALRRARLVRLPLRRGAARAP